MYDIPLPKLNEGIEKLELHRELRNFFAKCLARATTSVSIDMSNSEMFNTTGYPLVFGSNVKAHLDLSLLHYHQEDMESELEITAALETEDTPESVIVPDSLNRFSGLDIDE